VYNFPTVKNYTKDRKTRGLKIEFIVSFQVGIVLLVLMCSGFPVMEDLSHAGRSLTGHGKRHERVFRRE
jgi:hypothetical protein